MIDLADLTLSQRQNLILEGKIDKADIVKQSLENIASQQNLNAFINVNNHNQKDLPPETNQDVQNLKSKPLPGAVIAVKDNIAVTDFPLTCGSAFLRNYISPFSATAVSRILDAGALIVGKTNLDEFGMGSSNENSAFGPVLNPHDINRVPGGSSGGSAAALAAGLCTSALGSDTGGSVRQPAAFCGVLGLKPTYSRVSRYGLVAFASSLDQIGVLARHADELAAVFYSIAGEDDLDNTCSSQPLTPRAEAGVVIPENLRIGVPEEYMNQDIQPAISETIWEITGKLSKIGMKVSSCSLPNTKFALSAYYIISSAECSSNLARFDGIRYGCLQKRDSMEETVRNSRSSGFGQEVKRRITLGTFVLSTGYYSAYYTKAQKIRRLIRNDFLKAFEQFDLLLTPTTPTTAFRLGEKNDNPLKMYQSDILTVPASLAGLPAISCPFGVDEKSMPIGVQFIAPDFREDALLSIAALIEKLH